MKPAGIERVEKPANSLARVAMLRITTDRNPKTVNGCAGAGSFEDGQLFGRAGMVMKLVEAGLMRDVDEDDESVVHKSASGRGPRVGIFEWRRGFPGGHAGRPRLRKTLGLFGALLAEGKL